MIHGTFSVASIRSATRSRLIIDPVEYLAVDIATGRHLPGHIFSRETIAVEHGLADDQVDEALDSAWLLGLVSRPLASGSSIVQWSPDESQRHLFRVVRAMADVVRWGPSDHHRLPHDVIDGEGARFGAVDAFGLRVPADVELFLEVARALLSRRASAIVDEFVAPLSIFSSEAAQVVHGFAFTATEPERDEIVSRLVSALIDGRAAAFSALLDDYRHAMTVS